jgi:hypothetical protein
MRTVLIKAYGPTVSETDVDASKNLGDGLATTADIGQVMTDALGAIALFSSIDPSGSLLKATMMVKLFRRLRFIHVKFGISLNAFLVALDPGFA